MQYIAGLDLLRFIGALSVVALHLGSQMAFEQYGLGKFHILFSGNTGVTLFYVISGFLITNLIAREVQDSGSFNVPQFFLKRAIRIFPLYYLAMLGYLALEYFDVQKTNSTSLLYAFFYSYNFIPRASYDGWLGSFHTLATEEHFYILYPLMWALCLRWRMPVWGGLLFATILTPVTFALSAPYAETHFIFRWTFNAWSPILIGCLFGLYFAHNREGMHKNRLYLMPMFIVLFLSQVVAYNIYSLACAFGFLLLHMSYNQERVSIRFMGSKYIRYLGSISYGIYVWQSVIIATGSGRRLIADPAIAVLAVLALSVISWHLVEKPLASLRRKIGKNSPLANQAHSALVM